MQDLETDRSSCVNNIKVKENTLIKTQTKSRVERCTLSEFVTLNFVLLILGTDPKYRPVKYTQLPTQHSHTMY